MIHLDTLKRRAEIKQHLSQAITTEEWHKLPSDLRAALLLDFERISRLLTETKPCD